MVQIHNVEQGSVEWTMMRLGMITSSKLKSIIDLRTGGLKAKAQQETAMSKMIAEWQTGFSLDSDYQSEAMEWGLEKEEEVKEKYFNDYARNIGFATNDKYKFLGCSPDLMFVDDNGNFVSGMEIKCPNSDTHVKYIIQDRIPSDYMTQIYCYFLVFDTISSMTFVSYDPRNNVNDYFVRSIFRDDIAEMLDKVNESILIFESRLSKYK